MRRLTFLAITFVVLSLIGCKTSSTVSEAVRVTDSVRWETRYRDSVIIQRIDRDSIRIHDSVITLVDSAGNRTTDRWHTYIQYRTDASEVARYAAKIDSLTRISARDSVRIVKVTKEPGIKDRLELYIMRGLAALLAAALIIMWIRNKI